MQIRNSNTFSNQVWLDLANMQGKQAILDVEISKWFWGLRYDTDPALPSFDCRTIEIMLSDRLMADYSEENSDFPDNNGVFTNLLSRALEAVQWELIARDYLKLWIVKDRRDSREIEKVSNRAFLESQGFTISSEWFDARHISL